MKMMIDMKKSYEEANPGKPFILYVKEIFDDVIKNLDREIVTEISDNLGVIKNKFIEINSNSEISKFFGSKFFDINC